MVSLDADLAPEVAAALHEGLAHPARVATMRALRQEKALAPAALRAHLAQQGILVDATTMRFHLRKMQRAGLVDVGRDAVRLVRDVSLKLRLP